jgi:hypothetical protein
MKTTPLLEYYIGFTLKKCTNLKAIGRSEKEILIEFNQAYMQ